MPACEVRMVTCECPRRRAGSSSRPTRNMKTTTLACAPMPRRSVTWGVKSAPDAVGHSRPKREGPSTIPATISPMTGAWPSRDATKPRPRAKATTTISESRNEASSEDDAEAPAAPNPASPGARAGAGRGFEALPKGVANNSSEPSAVALGPRIPSSQGEERGRGHEHGHVERQAAEPARPEVGQVGQNFGSR